MRVSLQHPTRLNYELRIRGYTHRALAEELGLSRGAVSTALKTGSSSAVRELVARVLGCDPREIWPYRYPLAGIEAGGEGLLDSELPGSSTSEDAYHTGIPQRRCG